MLCPSSDDLRLVRRLRSEALARQVQSLGLPAECWIAKDDACCSCAHVSNSLFIGYPMLICKAGKGLAIVCHGFRRTFKRLGDRNE
jgi:hypothetical protein